MKSANILNIVSLLLVIILNSTMYIFAEDLDSTNYKIVGAKVATGGGLADSSNYSVISSLGKISADPRVYSTNYRLYQDPSSTFLAAQPSVQCFETTTDGTTSCTSGPSELLSGGMVAICGTGGCYDKARFEISPNSNPADTLYSVQISTDNFTSDIQYIDGSTFRPESYINHNINDYRTESVWETETFNIQGLKPNTQYYIRITALHGDFTESDYSITANTTTAAGNIFFDIDIAISSGITTESSPPYTIAFSNGSSLIAGAAAMTASSLIWLDIDSSASGGVSVIVSGKYGGLYSPTTTQTISSSTEDLDIFGAEGFGLQNYYINYDNSSPFYGDLTVTSDYSGNINNVGGVSTVAKKIYSGDGPIVSGRTGAYLKARAGTGITTASDYSENLYFVLVPLY